jgi:hypothetical protein
VTSSSEKRQPDRVFSTSRHFDHPLEEATARLRARAYADARSISSLAFDIVRGDGLFYDDPGSA